MLKPSILALAIGLIGLAACILPVSASAADLPVSVRPNRPQRCGVGNAVVFISPTFITENCDQPTGTGFDPRNFDTTEPHYYLGRMRAYPRYWVSAGPLY